MSKNSEQLYTDVVADIYRVADDAGIDPLTLSFKKYIAAGRYKAKDIDACGGFKSIIRDSFGPPERHYDIIAGQKARAAEIRRIGQIAGDKEWVVRQLNAKLSTIAAGLKPEKQKYKFPKPRGFLRENIGVLSDTHFGLDIDIEELRHNKYDWSIAARRLAKYVVQLADYKLEHRQDCPQLRLCLGGDICQGIIHKDTDHGTEMIAHQIEGAAQMLVQAIDYLRKVYSRIIVETTPDNHMRLPFDGAGRSTGQKYNSFATMMHNQLQMAYRNVPQVTFHIVKSPYTDFEVLGHRVFLTHGDTVLSAGSPGKTIHIDRISKRVNEIQVTAFSHDEKPYKAIIMGHVHVPVSTTLDGGVELIINGTGSGLDPYARSIGITSNNPCQVIFEATPDYVVGDFRKVYLKDADNDTRFDKIITPYNRSFKQPKI